jgi:predicted DCC family thiol-disulfide oxidoreductase YuxK
MPLVRTKKHSIHCSIRAMLNNPASATGAQRAAYSYRNDPAVPAFPDDRPIIVFDGYCVLCSGWISFVLRHDRHAIYRLLPAQSPIGHTLYVHYGLGPQDYETYIFIQDDIAWFKSEATIWMTLGLGFPWSLAGVLRIVPRSWRDRLYAWVARNRLCFFGRRDTCYGPLPHHKDRFLG